MDAAVDGEAKDSVADGAVEDSVADGVDSEVDGVDSEVAVGAVDGDEEDECGFRLA